MTRTTMTHSPSSPAGRAKRSAYMREYYRTHPEYAETVRQRAREKYALIMADPALRERERSRGRDKERRHRAARKKPDKVKVRARSLVESAVRCRRLTKPLYCQDCGGDHSRIEAHHDDYSQPLSVVWLCSICHGKRHKKRAA